MVLGVCCGWSRGPRALWRGCIETGCMKRCKGTGKRGRSFCSDSNVSRARIKYFVTRSLYMSRPSCRETGEVCTCWILQQKLYDVCKPRLDIMRHIAPTSGSTFPAAGSLASTVGFGGSHRAMQVQIVVWSDRVLRSKYFEVWYICTVDGQSLSHSPIHPPHQSLHVRPILVLNSFASQLASNLIRCHHTCCSSDSQSLAIFLVPRDLV